MGWLDALAIGAAGVGKGYRAGQELERQIAEAKRKALLEEGEAQIRERSQASQDALAQSQIGLQGVQSELGQEQLTGARTKRLREGEQGFPAGSQMDIGGSKFSLPTTQGGVNDISDILREGMNLNARIHNPYIFGGSDKPYLSADEQAQRDFAIAIAKELGPSPLETLDEDRSKAAEARVRRALMEFMPPRLRHLYKVAAKDTTGRGIGRTVGR